jgi:hypothetical protein
MEREREEGIRTRRRKVLKVQRQISQLSDSWNGGGVSMGSASDAAADLVPSWSCLPRFADLTPARRAQVKGRKKLGSETGRDRVTPSQHRRQDRRRRVAVHNVSTVRARSNGFLALCRFPAFFLSFFFLKKSPSKLIQ